MLAGLAVGVWKDEKELAEIWHSGSAFIPEHDESKASKALSLWHKAVKAFLGLGRISLAASYIRKERKKNDRYNRLRRRKYRERQKGL